MFWNRVKTTIIKPAELTAQISKGDPPVIVDVRGEKEFQAGHLPKAINIPLAELDLRKSELDSTKPTVFY